MYNDQKIEIINRLGQNGGQLTLVVTLNSPGYSAKMCTYIIMNCKANEVIDFIVIQKGQYQG